MPIAQRKDYCFAHQPILGRDNTTVAMELLYRSTQTNTSEVFNHTAATANVIVSAFSHIGMLELMGDRKLFINIAEELLLSDTVTLLPPDKITLELLEHVEATDEIVSRVRELKDMGYEFALDDYVFHEDASPFFDLVDIIKLDVLQADLHKLQDLVSYLRRWPCKLLAEKVETREVYELCAQLGFDLFQGYFFAHPTVLDGSLVDPNKLAILNLLAKVVGGAEFEEIEDAFKGNPGLTYSLLRLVNSPAFYSSHKIGSIRQALQVLGLRQLSRWLQVLLFTQQNDQSCTPILELAVHRGRLMELMAETLALSSDQAYVAGMLSLADTALGMPLSEIVTSLNLVDSVSLALLQRQGHLGRMLDICEHLEHAEFEQATALIQLLGIPILALTQMQEESITWTHQMLHTLFMAPQA